MSRQFDNQRRVACVKALDKNETSLMVLMKYHDQLIKMAGKIPFTGAGPKSSKKTFFEVLIYFLFFYSRTVSNGTFWQEKIAINLECLNPNPKIKENFMMSMFGKMNFSCHGHVF